MVLCVVNVDARFRSNPVDGSIVWDDGTDLYFRDYCHDTLILIFVKHQSREVGSGQYAQFRNLPDGLYADLFFYLLLGQEVDLLEIIRFRFVEV